MEAFFLSKSSLTIHVPVRRLLSTRKSPYSSQSSPKASVSIDTKLKLPQRPRWALYGLVGYGALVVAYGTYLYLAVKNIPESGTHDPARQEDVSHVYGRIAKDYDTQVSSSELFMGMGFLRKALANRLHGDVLEVCVGTGRNLKYYPVSKCSSITLVDYSPDMLDQARKVFRGGNDTTMILKNRNDLIVCSKEKYPNYKKARFILEDSANPIPSPTGQGYDVIIQTMGLCSHHSPVKLLENLGVLCKKDGGRIILIEHGRSYYTWCNKILDYYAPNHASSWGCWWNRDIELLLKESGFQVNKISRYHLGTTYWIEATPGGKHSET